MFNINDVSRMLREARIQKNLTQNALADQMGVTYQAVSNWERGTSVPDISNLARLCEILELDLYKLVGASQSQELTEELLASPDRLDSAPVDAIAAIAPMLPPRELEELVRAKKADIRNLSTLMQIAPFIDAALAEEIGAELTPAHIADVLGMSPFVSPELCAKWVERLEQQGDFELDTGLLSALGPFLPQERMDRLSERVVPEDLVILNSVAPFLSQDALCRMADRLEQITLEDYLLGVQCLMPFLGKEEMEKLHGKIRDSKKDAGERGSRSRCVFVRFNEYSDESVG